MCDHDVIDITLLGDTHYRGLCTKCTARFTGPAVLRIVEPWEWVDDALVQGVWHSDSVEVRTSTGTGEVQP